MTLRWGFTFTSRPSFFRPEEAYIRPTSIAVFKCNCNDRHTGFAVGKHSKINTILFLSPVTPGALGIRTNISPALAPSRVGVCDLWQSFVSGSYSLACLFPFHKFCFAVFSSVLCFLHLVSRSAQPPVLCSPCVSAPSVQSVPLSLSFLS